MGIYIYVYVCSTLYMKCVLNKKDLKLDNNIHIIFRNY